MSMCVSIWISLLFVLEYKSSKQAYFQSSKHQRAKCQVILISLHAPHGPPHASVLRPDLQLAVVQVGDEEAPVAEAGVDALFVPKLPHPEQRVFEVGH